MISAIGIFQEVGSANFIYLLHDLVLSHCIAVGVFGDIQKTSTRDNRQ